MRLFLLILIVWLFIVVLRQAKMKKKSNQASRHTDGQKNIPSSTIKCEYCGVYIPQQEAIQKQGHYYCSEKHALLSNDENSK